MSHVVSTWKELSSLSSYRIWTLEIFLFRSLHIICSLFNPDGRDETDRAIRAQVIPSVAYCRTVAINRASGKTMDYIGESFNSPIQGITRRYPSIVILKLFDSCPQIYVYCLWYPDVSSFYMDSFPALQFTTSCFFRWWHLHWSQPARMKSFLWLPLHLLLQY